MMRNLTQLRLAAREIFDETLCAVDPGRAVRRTVLLDELHLKLGNTAIDISNRKIYSVAIGKAAFNMAHALDQILGESLTAGFLSGPVLRTSVLGLSATHERSLTTRWRCCEGGHPLPNKNSLRAAGEVFELLRRANEERALIIFLISGGGSAMLEWPMTNDISLADLQSANRALVSCGASISEVNAVRRTFSAVKGGRLAQRAPDCDQITLIVSDVPRGEERNVASGPTLAAAEDGPDAAGVVNRYGLRTRLPESILRAIEKETATIESTPAVRHFVLLDNQTALQAAAETARRLGFRTEIAEEISDQSIEDGSQQLLHRTNALKDRWISESANETNAVCLISGGEFACPVKGDGLGGRNLETALRLAMGGSSTLAPFVALCAGTDGIDGNSPAAGAMIDSTTISRAHKIGLDPSAFLQRSDAYSFFVALGDVVATGATGTNVRDVRIVLASKI